MARWVKARRSPFGRALQAVGRADQRALVTLRGHGHTDLGDRFVQGLGLFGEMGTGWIALAGTGAALRPQQRERWLAAAAAAPIAILVNYSVKLTIGRERPVIDDHPPLARAPSKLSFPSAHSTSSVAAAVVIGRISPSARPLVYTLAGAICAGRPYLGMHYPSDVMAGAVLGTFLGRIYPLPAETPAPAETVSA
jgi:membrane-associated phospholipid phosphatase